MSRNSEKHFVALNRVFLEEQWKRERSLKRPNLSKLATADEVRKWIPSIKKEIEYTLAQLGGARKHKYVDSKLKDFEERLEYLEREHKRFVKKVFELDPSQTGIPWEPKVYTSKRKLQGSLSTDNKKKRPIMVNVLNDEVDNKEVD